MGEKSSLTIDERLRQLEKAKETTQTPPFPKIQKVAHHLRDRKHFTKHYSPRLVSFGPIHHGDKKLELGEHYKLIWARTYIQSYSGGQTAEALHQNITGKIEDLKKLFDTHLFNNDVLLSHEGFINSEENICWMLFVDGCALLHILECAKLDEPDIMNAKVDQLVLVMQDVLLLENQLPYALLKLLWRNSTTDDTSLVEIMKNFLRCHHWATNDEDNKPIGVVDFESPTHLLDLQRAIILYDPPPPPPPPRSKPNRNRNHQNEDTNMVTHRNIQELKAAGIVLKTSHTRRPRDISFCHRWLCSELTLPEIVVDDTTATTVLNLIAYEMCPDFKNDYGICSYVCFLDSLIDHPDDVKALRSKGILLNSLGSDEEVAKLFNIIGTDLVPDTGKYSHVSDGIERHYRNKWKTWITLGYHNYFSNPWAIIAFNAAAVGLALTFIQTWFAIYPAK
ncbi:hypothetical protein RJT34_03994 [Clitoria ternatea]|uniref:Uncharacterized protein n=1 Tax=Clitoria ternatea TaxID=43366 RepID=A0AAN9KKG0_CLITE